jgi:hypothetical protein
MDKQKSERFERLFRDIADAPSGPLKDDLTLVTVKDQFSDLFIRILAGHLLSLGYVRQEDTDSSDAAPQHPIKTTELCNSCTASNRYCCEYRSCRECRMYVSDCYDCRCLGIPFGDPCPYYKEANDGTN